MINYNLLESQIDNLAKSFAEAKPIRHLTIDNFLSEEVANQAFSVFPTMEEMDVLKDFRQDKAQDPAINKFNLIFSELVSQHLHSERFLALISRISGIPNLRTDSKLYAAGLAQGGNGSFLNVHIDNSSHPVNPWYRRLNLLVYLNKHWAEENGGNLELWSPDMSESVAILPIFNRMVIFATDKQSWHSYRRVNTLDGDTRKSINLYFFTEESADGTHYYHVTSFKARKNEILNKIVYPVDNLVRTVARALRPNKDAHAVLYEQKGKNDRKNP
ncbi:2OG-Fe(II) oxygenase [Argonema galeatum]|uniref:2OG-Fe(II) oxygenase n=1 Tax=Argonema galeatum TaxID=2942762 RepID=UPI0020121E95|nr:2OG-Fe(II) oxygenase [Argonema galeatum]MCL1468528.1 2OG-Fe(II) oxygenase [Argonema galeatum A003/A1]